jgi:hypothetical protein
MPNPDESYLKLLSDFENELENRAKFPDPKKSENFKKIIERLADPESYKSMLDAINSEPFKHFLTKEFLTNHFKENYNKMNQAAINQANYLIEKYMEIMNPESEVEKEYNLTLNLKILKDKIIENIKDGTCVELDNFPDNIKPLAKQMEAIFRERILLSPKKPEEKYTLDDYRSRIVAAHKSLTEPRTAENGKKYTDLEIITKDPSPVTTAFKKAYYAVANALFMITSPSLLMRTQDSNVSNRHSFWKPPSDNLKKSVKDVEEDLHLTTPKKPR